MPADGAIAFALMLYLAPSIARARVKPMMAAFAAEYYMTVQLVLCKLSKSFGALTLA